MTLWQATDVLLVVRLPAPGPGFEMLGGSGARAIPLFAALAWVFAELVAAAAFTVAPQRGRS